MTFEEILNQAMALLQRQGRVSYRALKRQFDLDEAYVEDLKLELIEVHQVAVDQDNTMLVWTGGAAVPPPPAATPVPVRAARAGDCATGLHAPLSGGENPDLPQRPGRRTQAGHGAVCRPQGSMELIRDLDPEDAQHSWIPPCSA